MIRTEKRDIRIAEDAMEAQAILSEVEKLLARATRLVTEAREQNRAICIEIEQPKIVHIQSRRSVTPAA